MIWKMLIDFFFAVIRNSFKAVSDLVKFNWVSSYEDFKAKFGVKDSIS